jgi:hypothetical protein
MLAVFTASRGHAIGYHAGDGRWWRWRSCADCGGVELPLLSRPAPCDVEALTLRLAMRRCPECETRRHRAGRAAGGPIVWYDTRLGDWVVQLAGYGALLPLEIEVFDAPEATVYRAASDIVHSGDALDGGLPPA